MNPWSWIAAVFILHSVGSVLVVRLFLLDLGEVAVPISIAVLGAVLFLGLRWYDRSLKLGAWKWWLPAGMYALFIFVLSSAAYSPGEVPCSTKDFHIIEYSTLGVLLCRVWHSSFAAGEWVPLALRVLPLGVLFAASDEIHQSFTPGRSAAFSDVFIDTASLCAGIAFFVAVRYAVSFGDTSSGSAN